MVGLDLPKVELSYFDGQPTAYWMFIRQFETYVASRVIDDSQRLLYLIHYCKGKAKSAIEGCVMMDPTAGYSKAREILKRLFGQPHIIARETLEGLFSEINDYSDAGKLANLAVKMENCAMVLNQMNYNHDLNSLATLERIVKLLPRSLQVQWADIVDTLTENVREPTFAELTNFIASRARVASSRFGQLATCMKKGYNAKMNCYLQSEQYSSLAVKRKCSICSKDHDIYLCPSFISMTVEDRWAHARSKGACFVCLKRGHRASECKSTKRCNVEECLKRHHYLLHSNRQVNPLESNSNVESHCGYTKSLGHHVCLGMIPIRLRSKHAEVVGYALLDNGSDATLIRSDCLKSLGLKEEQVSIV
ncbi:Gag-Pol polyprotein, partial [Schistosoma japonicum]